MEKIFERAIIKNRQRLSEAPYTIEHVFRPASYDWPGDWEGRALLAFVCHAQMGNEIPCLKKMLEKLPEKIAGKGYFGGRFDECAIDEQQLAGHNWLLRGLLEAEKTGERAAGGLADRLVESLYVPALGFYEDYPTEKRAISGGVSGTGGAALREWRLSTDVGCAFISLDGLAEYYGRTGDRRLKGLLESAVDKFASLDFVGLKVQTHATLSALRGILTFYESTGESKYLELVRRIYDLYFGEGMTLTFENYNWFGRRDTWTEPCAVVDSLILALRLYKITGEREYGRRARRICFNGLRFCQRENGGAGPNTCVTREQPYLKVFMYEAPFCCTMRYAEGLLWISKNEELFADEGGEVVLEDGRYFRGDNLLVSDMVGAFSAREHIKADGRELIEIPSLADVEERTANKIALKAYFGD